MIELNEIFSDADKRLALFCEATMESTDLAALANNIIENSINLISVTPEMVPLMWTYLEKNKVKILARYDFRNIHKDIDNDISTLSKDITKICKSGANGVQLFIKMRDFERILDVLNTVRDDLFFGHDLCVMMDILDVDVNNWQMIFEKLCNVRANAFGVFLSEDAGIHSDFIGRIYSMLQNWNGNFELQFLLANNTERIDQSIRLIESLQPALMSKTHFFLQN